MYSKLLPLFSVFPLYYAGAVGQGGNCSTNNDHLDPSTHKFISDCTERTYCTGSANATCQPRLCRRDEFPFGYPYGEPIPPMCEAGQFCPDQGDGCRPLLSVGERCQMGRDEQCSPPPSYEELKSTSNNKGSLCLNLACSYSNATLGQACLREETTYTDQNVNGQPYTNKVVRDNCRSPMFYCEAGQNLCQSSKSVGEACQSDAECVARYCLNERCSNPPGTPVLVPAWEYALTAILIILGMGTTGTAITLIHRHQRYKHYRELRDYYFEQISLRRSIIALHASVSDKGNAKDRS